MHVDKNVSNDFLYNPGNNPSEKKYWNFKAVFLRNSAGIPEVNIWNQSGTLMEFHWNTNVEFFMYFLILLYPKRVWRKSCTVGT